MNEREEDRILRLLYDETAESKADEALSDDAAEELEAFRDVLARVRSIPDEEPSPHLDALILAQARAVAEKAELEHRPWWRRVLAGPGVGVALAATATVFVAVLVVPQMRESQPESQSIPSAGLAEVAKLQPEGAKDQAEGLERAPRALTATPPTVSAPEAVEEAESEREAPPPARASRGSARTRAGSGRRSDLEDEGGALAQKPSEDRAADSLLEKKGDALASRGPSTVGTLGAASGGAAGAAGADKDRRLRDEASELDGLVSRAKAKKEIAASPPAEMARNEATSKTASAEAPPASAAPPAPAAEPSESAGAAAPPDPRPTDAPAKRAAPKPSVADDEAVAPIAGIRARARQLESAGDVAGARRYLLSTRQAYVGRPMYEEVSYELAELEFRQRRYESAQAFARDVLTTKDERLAARARVLIRRAQEAPR